MDEYIRGVMHIHSKYSYDGTLSPEELVRLCKTKGNRFIILTEHADDFDDDKMDMLVNECNKLSSKELIMIPGLEFDCEGMHILAVGIEKFIPQSNLGGLIREIHKQGGLAILAHVVFYGDIPHESLKDIDGVEVWNPRYEGRFSPSLKSLNILRRFRKQSRGILAFSGLDLHEKYGFGKISTILHTNELSRDGIIRALREGRFHTSNGLINFDSQKDPSLHKLFIFYVIRFPYWIGKTLRKTISITLDKLGIEPPKALLKTLRRVF